MINFRFNIHNPYSTRWDILANPCWQISENKIVELQFNRTNDIIGLDFQINTRQDHAGVFLCVALLGFDAMFQFYDRRHLV